jgi:hypothetical protein
VSDFVTVDVPQLLEFAADLPVVVDLAVEDHADVPSSFASGCCPVEIDDAETTMGESRMLVAVESGLVWPR